MLGARIAALRRRAGMSQAELAKRLKVSASAIGMYEQGRRQPAADTLVALGGVFGVSVDYLLTGRSTESENQMVDALVNQAVETAQAALNHRTGAKLSQKELAALIAVMLMEP